MRSNLYFVKYSVRQIPDTTIYLNFTVDIGSDLLDGGKFLDAINKIAITSIKKDHGIDIDKGDIDVKFVTLIDSIKK